MIDQRARKFLDSLKPIGRNALLAPYRNFGDLMSLSDATSMADYEERCRRINEAADERWAADFMAGYYRDQAGKLRLRPYQLDALPAGAELPEIDPQQTIHRQAQQYGARSFNEAMEMILNTPEPEPTEPPKQETWRDRPPLL